MKPDIVEMIWLLLGIVLLITAVLLFPVTIRTRSFRSEGILDGSFSISWLIFGMRYMLEDKQTEILILNRTLIRRQNKEKTPEDVDTKAPVKSKSNPPVKDFIPLAGPAIRLIRELLSAVRLRHFELDTVYGLEDPATTGMLTGYLHALTVPRIISFTPDFTQPVLDWDLDLAAGFTPIAAVPPITRFATDLRVLRAGWRIIRS
ncbi:MAG: DUF2953 domain-containing protein [Methanosarcinales archaeon]|nr:DUF2953 domain-containing protein [Methanosarcinales archaeon]